jgi:hypothetical protein
MSAHSDKGVFITSGGDEYNVAVGAAALSPAFSGPGRPSGDELAGCVLAGTVRICFGGACAGGDGWSCWRRVRWIL